MVNWFFINLAIKINCLTCYLARLNLAFYVCSLFFFFAIFYHCQIWLATLLLMKKNWICYERLTCFVEIYSVSNGFNSAPFRLRHLLWTKKKTKKHLVPGHICHFVISRIHQCHGRTVGVYSMRKTIWTLFKCSISKWSSETFSKASLQTPMPPDTPVAWDPDWLLATLWKASVMKPNKSCTKTRRNDRISVLTHSFSWYEDYVSTPHSHPLKWTCKKMTYHENILKTGLHLDHRKLIETFYIIQNCIYSWLFLFLLRIQSVYLEALHSAFTERVSFFKVLLKKEVGGRVQEL